MPEMSRKPAARLDPAPVWTVLTEAPLKGLMLAREARLILAWDDAQQLYLYDLDGRQRGALRVAGPIVAAAISDDGSRIAVLTAGPTIHLLGSELEPVHDRAAPPDASALALDPHGLYLAVASRLGLTQLYNRHGRPAGRFETRQPLNHLVFVPTRLFLVGAATFGMLFGIALEANDSGGRLDAEEEWYEELHSNVGRLTLTGDGGMVLASCFSHGVLRFDLAGRHEGAYHLGGTAAQAVPDFAGRLIAVATVEGELAILNSAGNVRWKTTLARPATALEVDPLGEYLIYGHATGEIIRLDLDGSNQPASAAPAVAEARARPGASSVRSPAWSIPVATSDEQAESAVVAVLDDPPRIGLITRNNKLQIFTAGGKLLGQAPELLGVGRFVRTAPGWMAAATDRQVILFDAKQNLTQRLDLSLVEITHLAIRPDTYGLAVVQERDRLGRATRDGRWVWKTELRAAIEELALGPQGYTAVTTTAGRLLIYDGAGAMTERPLGEATDPPCVIEAPDFAPDGVVWLTLTRREQVLRGHDLSGRPLWEAPVPWESWQLLRLGSLALVAAPDGRALAFDGGGNPQGQSQGAGAGSPTDLFGLGPRDEALRISRSGIHLICATLDGRVAWRAVADVPIGPCAVGRSGIAVLLGRSLAWFPMHIGRA